MWFCFKLQASISNYSSPPDSAGSLFATTSFHRILDLLLCDFFAERQSRKVWPFERQHPATLCSGTSPWIWARTESSLWSVRGRLPYLEKGKSSIVSNSNTHSIKCGQSRGPLFKTIPLQFLSKFSKVLNVQLQIEGVSVEWCERQSRFPQLLS